MNPTAPLFTESDRRHIFTKAELQARLGQEITVRWFLQEFSIPTRCRGNLIAGGDIVRAVEAPPAPKSPCESPMIPQANLALPKRGPGRPRKTFRDSGTCADLQLLPTRKE